MRSTSRVFIVLALISTFLNAPGVVAPSAATDHLIDFGVVFGGAQTKVQSYTATGSDITVAPIFISGPFEIVQDLCSGAELADGEACIVRVRPQEDFPPGAQTGTLQFRDENFQNIESYTLSAHGVVGVFAFTTMPFGPGAGVTRSFSQTNATMGFTTAGSSISLSAEANGESYRFGISSATVEPLPPGKYRTPWGLGANGPSLSLSGERQCEDGEFTVYESAVNVDGDVTHLRASFVFDCGISGVVAIDSEPVAESVWVGPPSMDLGVVNEDSVSVSAFAVNLTGQARSVGPTASSLTGASVTKDECGEAGTVAPWSACAVQIATSGLFQDQQLGGTLTLNIDNEATDIGVQGTQAVSRITSYQGWSQSTRASFRTISTFDQAVEVSTDFFGTIIYTTNGSPAATAVVHMGNPRLGVGTYELGTTGPGEFPLTFSGSCREQGSELRVHKADWSAEGEIESFLASFTLVCPVGAPIVGIATVNSGIDVGLVEPSWLFHEFLTYEPGQSERTLQLRNTGDRPAFIDLDLTVNTEFAFVLVDGGCDGVTLLPGQSCDQRIRFSPISRTGESLTAVVTIGGVHAFAGMEVVLTGETPESWPITTAATKSPESGYWLLHADGSVSPFGDARNSGNAETGGGAAVRIEPTPSGRGYWILGDQGQLWTGGDARHLGQLTPADLASFEPGEIPVSLSSTPTGDGYWIFTSQGRVFAFGDATDIGDLLGITLANPIIDSMATPSGLGVYMIGTDGGVFALGDAAFAGSVPQVLPGVQLNSPIVGIVADPDGSGYWLVAADGGVFAFSADFRGSVPGALPPGTVLDQPVNGMVPFGNGYLLVASDGGVFNFSTKPFDGSLGGQELASPVVAIAPIG